MEKFSIKWVLLKGAKRRSRRSDYIYTMCKFHLYLITLLLCQIALRSYSPLEVYCTSFHYLQAAPFIHLHAGYACRWNYKQFYCLSIAVLPQMRVSGYACFRLAAFHGACRWSACRACDPKKGSQFYYAIGLWPSLKREAHNNKNFVSKQIFICLSTWNVYIFCRTGIRVILLLISFKFHLNYIWMFAGEFFFAFV